MRSMADVAGASRKRVIAEVLLHAASAAFCGEPAGAFVSVVHSGASRQAES
eukprot:CAMPEP_0198556982 /NCGR_PEP_ID=MMETSP1462-20131121/87783_1 /TAXON_ID=1333877 /ORGANISM="Brandtodinium nutriculum, Strain RCC3387" /LENGTH=50 /DNA_ID=CAMNT_0044287743 /DNA_START=174 /DNA_END=324 /DNA_ORIENTATION=+